MTRARYVSNPQAIDIPLTVSANLTANAVITVGNSSVNSVITSNTYSVGSNVSLSTSRLFLGNSTVNSVHTASTLDVGANVNLSTVGLNVGSNTVNAYINSTSFAIGNSTVNTAITSTTITSTALLSIGNTNITGTANVSTGINVGANINLSTSQINVGNATVNTVITSTSLSTNGITVSGGTANGVAYLNGSKVLTTGSALTFDGTTLTNTRNTTDGSASTLTLNNSGATGSYATLNLNAGSVTYQQFSDAAGNAIGTAGAMFRTTSNHPLIWGTNNTERMRLDSSGNLGIGTSSPAYKLQVANNGNFNTTINVTNTTTGTSSYARFLSISNGGSASFGMTSTTYTDVTSAADALLINADGAGGGIVFAHDGVGKMFFDSSGNLGIGTTAPGLYSAKIVSSGNISILSGSKLYLWDSTNTYTPALLANGNNLTFIGNSGSEQVRIDSNGNLVIGNTSAWARLHATKSVNNTNASATNISDYQNATFILHNQDDAGTGNKAGMFFAFAGSPGILAGMDGYKVSGNWNTGLRWYTNNSTGVNVGNFTERMRLDPDGRLGLGVTSPTWMLEVQGAQESLASFRPSTSTSAGYARFINGGGTFYIGIESSNGTRISGSGLAYAASMTTEGNTALTFGTNNTNRMTIDTSGNLVVGGTTAYSARLYVQGNSLGSSGTLYKFGDQHTYKWGGYNSQVGNSGRTLFAYGYDPLNWNYHYLKLKIKRGYYYASGYAEYMINCQNGTVTQVSQTDSGTTTSSITLSNNTVNSNYRITTVSFVSPANYTTWDFELEFWGMTPVSWTTTPGAGNIALN